MHEQQKLEIPDAVKQHSLPAVQNAQQEVAELVARAELVQVRTADEYRTAVEVCQKIAAQKQRRENERLDITRKMDEAKRSVMDFFRDTFLTPLERVDVVIRGKLKAYDAEQKRIADEQRRQAEERAKRERAEIERKAREEQQRAEAKAKAEREEAERQRQAAAEAARKAEEARRAGDAEAARQAQAAAQTAAAAAQKSEAKAATIETRSAERVETLEARAASVVAPVILAEQPKVKGNTRRMVKKFRIVDASKIDRRYLMPDESKIDKQVKALGKEAEELVGGIEVWEEPDLSIRAAK